MHYEDILRKIEQENRDGSLIDIYRYNGLLKLYNSSQTGLQWNR